jgi:hypothetical protein
VGQLDFVPPLPWLLLGELAIRAALGLLMPRLRSPSYCLSSFTLGP